MRITVILCTYNRCRSLARALNSVAASAIPESVEWEVLVVDNNSSDQTREVVENFCMRFPGRFRYLFEPNQGKSFALNRGIHDSSGEVVAFIDDDVVVEPDWLHELTKPFSDSRWVGTGGRVYLPKEFSPPSWMAVEGNQSLGSILAQFDLGTEACELTRPPIGNNMAFRKEVFERHGGFRTDLGPRPGSEIRYEDTELGFRVMKAGGKVLYVPSAVVRHDVERERLTKEYFLAYHFDYGRALIREKGKRKPVGIVPRSVISVSNRCLNILPRMTWWWLRESDPQKRFFNKCRVWTTAGEIAEICRRALHGLKEIPRTSGNRSEDGDTVSGIDRISNGLG
jgi:glucosyl-dolichyl phosphate glucuronosyltransferase